MNIINEHQPEQNRENLVGTLAIAKIQELVKQSPTCFFCTSMTTGKRFQTRPMAVQIVDDSGRLWLLSASDSNLDAELAANPATQLLFQGSSHSDFLTLYGHTTVSRDPQKIKELWSPLMKTWFTEGQTDPRITVLCMEPDLGYYWDTKHNRAIVFAKMVVGAMLGKSLDDSIEGKLLV